MLCEFGAEVWRAWGMFSAAKRIIIKFVSVVLVLVSCRMRLQFIGECNGQ